MCYLLTSFHRVRIKSGLRFLSRPYLFPNLYPSFPHHLQLWIYRSTLVLVFHRILDFIRGWISIRPFSFLRSSTILPPYKLCTSSRSFTCQNRAVLRCTGELCCCSFVAEVDWSLNPIPKEKANQNQCPWKQPSSKFFVKNPNPGKTKQNPVSVNFFLFPTSSGTVFQTKGAKP